MFTRLCGVLGLLFALVLGGCKGMSGTEGDAGEKPSPMAGPVDGYAAHPTRIYVDEEGRDWAEVPARHVDTEDDGEGIDIERLWTAHTEQHLFLRLEVGEPINLQEENDLTLHLDADDDITTGEQTLGMGAELSWTFGERSGEVVRNGDAEEVSHADIGLSTLPTTRAETFEIALDRSAAPGGEALIQSDSLRIAVSNEGDRLPDEDGGLGYELSAAETPLEAPSIDRPAASDVRLLSSNSVNDFDEDLSAIFSAERQPSYRRILDAVGPDVIAFQEVYAQTAAEVDSVTETRLGLSADWEWAKQGQDLVVGSRYPILDTRPISGYDDYQSGAFLLDARDALGSKLLAINMHPPCCNYGPDDDEPSRNTQRQQVVDGVVAFLRGVQQGEGPFGIAPDTPIVILGDMNFVGDAQQPRTLRTGDIIHSDRFGPDAAPDWDGSSLLDTKPRQVNSPMHTTWINPESSFPPGRLDYAFVTDSVLEVVREFVLHTPTLSESTLSTYGLQAEDTNRASDHLPVVIDVTAQ